MFRVINRHDAALSRGVVLPSTDSWPLRFDRFTSFTQDFSFNMAVVRLLHSCQMSARTINIPL